MRLTQLILNLCKKVLLLLQFRPLLLPSDLGFQLVLCQHYLLFLKVLCSCQSTNSRLCLKSTKYHPSVVNQERRSCQGFFRTVSSLHRQKAVFASLRCQFGCHTVNKLSSLNWSKSLQNDLVGVEPAASIRSTCDTI